MLLGNFCCSLSPMMPFFARIGSKAKPFQHTVSAALTRNFMASSKLLLEVRPSATRISNPRKSYVLIIAAPISDHDVANRGGGDADYKILMLKRNDKSSFIHAHVFPGLSYLGLPVRHIFIADAVEFCHRLFSVHLTGGNVDEFDKNPIWEDFFSGIEPAKRYKVIRFIPNAQFHALRNSTPSQAHRLCAVRETFEEAGILLTEPTVSDDVDLERWRHLVHTHALNFHTLCTQHHITPATADLVHFSQWINPIVEKRRYSTHFFLTVLPADKVAHQPPSSPTPLKSGQPVASVDGHETVQLDWFTPAEALSAWRRGDISLFPPQWYTLLELNKVARIEDLRERAGRGAFRGAHGGVVTLQPHLLPTPEDDALHDDFVAFGALAGDEMSSTNQGKKGDRHRFYIKRKDGRFLDLVLVKNVEVPEGEAAQMKL
ncbi:hypothetical protein BC936DRAFT_139613 [Jimgerdemannia flammicorona]|uniref:Nudix hydrolase domain-containing protein n=1 Tax=Jimgerdemannia flammicorona TaxID=994334 RepID=A0A433DHQ4_9FUNG|nr:hypothetical protein BC936DRAFT_139613 [Jimgerdemannia flammicorona]